MHFLVWCIRYIYILGKNGKSLCGHLLRFACDPSTFWVLPSSCNQDNPEFGLHRNLVAFQIILAHDTSIHIPSRELTYPYISHLWNMNNKLAIWEGLGWLLKGTYTIPRGLLSIWQDGLSIADSPRNFQWFRTRRYWCGRWWLTHIAVGGDFR